LSSEPRILVVDDEDEIRTFFARILLNEGYCVTTVATARHALSELRDRGFELVVLDFSLPDGDGLQKTRQIRCEFPLLLILAISGFMVGDMPREAIAAGASATLSKPITSSALRRSVSELLTHADSGVQRYKIAGG
jgi:two-component system, NtrC family, response regulator PilR